ncbi:RHS repeat-associated core domain-containing protein [Flavobacterium filum]|uniref:RHS repeat-associated core domain-containing protein n=1 Tax=Flavobacterium filum TaxID=370974 RepID=UPI00042525DF|nr:RHS repeat-associated core domain-containing protein [Flavobacterium filum]
MCKFSFYFSFFLLLFSNVIVCQNTELIELQYDISGYENNVFNRNSINQNAPVNTDTIPTIKSEMNVSESGAMTYMVPIDIVEGRNSFHPNIALVYNSQSGNGMAGWAWNISGLSTITLGGKSKFIDGITKGSQFDGSDPFYLDGERLLTVSPTIFETQKYSKIKINRDLSATQSNGYSFTVQYTDGKIAKYREIVPGQHMIVLLKDSFDNEIHYTYTIFHNVAYISMISYGGTTVINDIYKIIFNYETRTISPIFYRNGIPFKNTKVLKEIETKTSLLSQNNGRYRIYTLFYDKIQGNKVERLRKIEIENENGAKLKPLNFYYNSIQTGTIENEVTYSNPIPYSTTQLGSVAIGDFYKMGKPVSVYEAKHDWYYTIVGNHISHFGNYYDSKELFAGKCLLNGKLNDNDQLLTISTEYRGYLSSLVNGASTNDLVDRITFDFRDLNTGQFLYFGFDFPAGATSLPTMFNNTIVNDGERNKSGREFITGDFNNDGITDIIIFEKADLLRPQKIYFKEIGKSGSSLIVLTGAQLIEDSRIFQIEFDGDGIPELMVVGKENGIYNLYKIDLTSNSIIPIQGQQNIQLTNYNKRTPLIFGDFNGDGLTDFITPQKVYRFEDSNPAYEVFKMESEQLLWWQYISTGNGNSGFIKTQKDYTEQKLAYLAPSQRHVIKKGAFWDNFWAGNADSYDYTEYGACTILPIDIDNDGKTDLASFRKFGKVKYNQNGLLRNATVEGLDTFFMPIGPTGSFVIPPTNTVNKLFFHQNIIDNNGNPQLVNLPTVLSLQNVNISPFSVAVSNSDYNQLNSYKSQIYIIDAISQSRRISINNDNFNEGLIRNIDNGSSIIQEVEYRPMSEKNSNNNERTYSTSSNTPSYPIYVPKNSGITYLVHKIHTLFDNSILTKEYRFQNAIQDLSGKGFLGFQKNFESDLYSSKLLDSNYFPANVLKPTFWTIKTYNPTMDNVLVSKTYGSLNQSISNNQSNQNPNSVFTQTAITNFKFDMGNNRYLILPISEKNYDFLNDITISKTFQYDSNNELLLKQVLTDYNSQASSLEKYFYTPEFNDGEHYYYGKFSKIENTNVRDGVIFTTSNENTYNPNGTLLQTKKFGISSNLASMQSVPSIVTDYTYNTFGNIETETLSTSSVATSSGIVSLTTSYEYDSTQRYVSKITSPDGLFKISNKNSLGRITSEISELGLTTSYKYDSWGNVKEITDFLGKKTTIKKMLGSIPGSYIISKKREGEAEVRVLMDKFNREIKTSTQTINNQWINVSTTYNVLGNKTSVSEPYFDDDIILNNTIEYDNLNRPIKNILFNGKIITTCYEKMKVTVDDGFKKTAKWLDATGNTIRFKDNGGEIFYKYYPNGSLKETDYQGIKTKIEIDAWGNKTKLIDPSAGTYLYENDNLGRIKKETNPRGGITNYTYDDWGRPLTENTIGGSGENTIIQKSFSYDSATHLPNEINGSYNGKSFTYTTFYDDPFHRVTGKKEQTPDFTYETSTTFDDQGRIDVTKIKTVLNTPNYTSETNIKNNYDNNSFLISQTDLGNSQVIWTVNSINSHGKTTHMTYGNNYVLNTTYDANTLSLNKIKHEKDGVAAVDIEYTYDVQRGVLLNRNNLIFEKNEVFEYDVLNRLLNETINGIISQNYTYDNKGRMTSNTDIGKYNYNENNYKLESINFNDNGSLLNIERGFTEVQYNTFKNPNEIFLASKDRISYEYSILQTRSLAYYGSLDTDPTQRPIRKYYSADKAIEIIKEDNTTKIITYITGDPYNSNYIKIELLTGNALTSLNHYYLHRDSQSSIVAISKADSSGALVEQRYFDAWGNLKNAIVSNVSITPNSLGWISSLILDRGYTGHEHLNTVGLIHMNGRLYDPKLKRFLSPDNFVQDAFNTQNYNRYGYVLNNPLLYTDPSGEVFGIDDAIIIGIAVAVISNAVNNVINGVPFWYGTGKAAVIGGASAAISFGIGQATSGLAIFDKALLQAGMHGMSGGLMNVLGGGEFGSGFASGVVSSLISSVIQARVEGKNFATNNPGAFKAIMIASGGLSGGFSSTIAGGKFVDGFRQGIITSGLNHLVHNLVDNGDPKKDYKTWFKNKLKELDRIVSSSPRNALRFYFNTVENVGTAIEVGALVAAPFTEGASLTILPSAFQINTVGVIGNSMIDIYDGKLGAASMRLTKHFAFLGLGRALNKMSYGFVDKYILELHIFMYDKFIIPIIGNSILDSRSYFTPIEYKFDNNFNPIRK